MAALPPLAQIVGSHQGIYEAYYQQADPRGTGSIGSLDAAIFLKKSKLKDTTLSQVWDLSDPTGKGYLEKTGFFVALKYIALAQNGQDLNIAKLTVDTPPPNLGPVEPVVVESPANSAWTVKASEKAKYDQVFESLGPVNGLLSGDKVKPVLLNSKLPTDVLGRIWDLSDIDKDGYLDKDEFCVTMHLVYRARENDPTPMALPPDLVPPSKRKKGPALPGAVPVMPGLPRTETGAATPPPAPQVVGKPWVVSAAEKANADTMFMKLDTDMDGFVSGAEVRTILVQSGLQNALLAHIWTLSDINSVGKLNAEQFALAMYLVQQKLKGVEPPTTLTPEMIPPSMRPKTGADPAAFGVMDATNAGPYSHVADFSAIKELDSISKEIDEIKREKMQIERDKVQREADIKIRQGEVQMLQKELDAMSSTLLQLETQKKEAQKRLDELGDKRSDLESSVADLREKCRVEKAEVDKLRDQINNQEKSVMDQESDLERLRVELSELRREESGLEQQVESGKVQLDSLIKSQKELQLQVNQTQARVTHLRDQQRGLASSIGGYSAQINGDMTSGYSDTDQFSTRTTIGSSPVSTLSGFSMGSTVDDFKEDPFKGKDPFNNSGEGGGQSDPFQNDDPFKDSDPFKSSDGFQADPFASDDPFQESFGSNKAKSDPFGSEDPFAGSSFPSSGSSQKPQSNFHDPFASSSSSPSKQKGVSGDVFGSDPFAPSSSSPSSSPARPPSLPPKSKKQPPPRPAPPKSKSPLPTSSNKPKVDPFGGFGADPFSGSDPFSNSGSGSGGGGSGSDPFANFADFSPGKFTVDEDAWENKTAEERTIKIGGTHPVPKSRSKPITLTSSVDDETDV